jgi:hypothetical protein
MSSVSRRLLRERACTRRTFSGLTQQQDLCHGTSIRADDMSLGTPQELLGAREQFVDASEGGASACPLVQPSRRPREPRTRSLGLGRPQEACTSLRSAYVAVAFPGRGALSGGLALEVRSDAGFTSVLPFGPARTALCSALPRHRARHDRNHTVQPLSQVPPRGLPVIVTGSPGTASW